MSVFTPWKSHSQFDEEHAMCFLAFLSVAGMWDEVACSFKRNGRRWQRMPLELTMLPSQAPRCVYVGCIYCLGNQAG